MSRQFFFFDKKMLLFLFLMMVAYIAMRIYGPVETLDTKFYYSGAKAYDLFQHMTTADIYAYRLNEYFDLLLLISYTAALFVGLKKVLPSNSKIPLIALLPGLSDLIETIAILYALYSSGEQNYFEWLGFITLFKWASGAFAIGLMIFGVMRRLRTLQESNST